MSYFMETCIIFFKFNCFSLTTFFAWSACFLTSCLGRVDTARLPSRLHNCPAYAQTMLKTPERRCRHGFSADNVQRRFLQVQLGYQDVHSFKHRGWKHSSPRADNASDRVRKLQSRIASTYDKTPAKLCMASFIEFFVKLLL